MPTQEVVDFNPYSPKIIRYTHYKGNYITN